MKRIALFLLSVAIAMAIGMCAIALDMSDRAVWSVSIFGGIAVAVVLGVFDEPAKTSSIKRSSAKDVKRYTKAA